MTTRPRTRPFPTTPHLLKPALCLRCFFLTKWEWRERCRIIEMGEMRIVEKTERARMRSHPGSFYGRQPIKTGDSCPPCSVESGAVLGNGDGVSELPPRCLPTSRKSLGRGSGGETFLQKGPPPVSLSLSLSLNTGPAQSWSRPPYGSRRCCRRGHSCRARRIPRRCHGRP